MIYSPYQVGGSLASNAPTYVERDADTHLYEAIKAGELCYVLNSRQMGKSSLLVRTRHRLECEGFRCTCIDLSRIGSNDITPPQWYKGIVSELWMGFNLPGKVNLKQWWQDRRDLSYIQRLSWFISEIAIAHFPEQKLAIFFDEIDSTIALNFKVDDFFALIRSFYNQRSQNPEYKRVTFALFGVGTPSALIQDKQRTPFNIGRAIDLHGFTFDEAQPLLPGLEPRGNAPALLRAILDWTGGQPFLTQKLCHLVREEDGVAFSEVNGDDRPGRTIAPGREAEYVERIVRSHIIDRWQTNDDPEHLKTIRDRLLRDECQTGKILSLYQQILDGDVVPVNDSWEQVELRLSGLVENHRGQLVVKNPIYRHVFNGDWVRSQLDRLRPYAVELHGWLASNCEDTSHLLRGRALQESLAWASTKALGELDYRFLGASQALAKQEVERDLVAEKQARQLDVEKAQFALESAREAHQILERARAIARYETQNWRLGKGWMTSVAGGVASVLLLLRSLGVFQGMELATFDRFVQARPAQPVDPRIAIVTVNEADLQKIGQFPIPDDVLARTLKIINRAEPRAIGLDLYRDLPVEPGYRELLDVFENSPHVYGIDKVVGGKVAPPPALAAKGQVGFADQVLDADGTVRRALLSIRPRDGQLKLNLGLHLALHYLKEEGIVPYAVANRPDRMQIGKSLLLPFDRNGGGYVNADSGGYQILLNFRGTEEQFQLISISDILSERVPPEALRDRVILIGMTAESVNDLFQTPYTRKFVGQPNLMAGVTLHANIVSQVLTAALEGDALLYVWSDPVEWIWTLLWAWIGAALSWQVRSPRWRLSVVAIATSFPIAIAYVSFLFGWWIPVVPPLFALVGAAIGLPAIASRELEKMQLHETVKLILTMIPVKPAAGQIALEYLKQAENRENQVEIERFVRNLSDNPAVSKLFD
ncbi:MAG: CHASE2 domain-containing protein [Cyanobacteria bacterium J007]|nr:MAG: CHASE2 domain-containing protein [Cyanobacteria bacterium J007]